MTTAQLPYSLPEILFSTFEAGSDPDMGRVDYSLLDGRHDFIADSRIGGIAVLMRFTNIRLFDTGNAPGVRRKVSVALCDASERDAVVATAETNVYIPMGELTVFCHAVLKIGYMDIRPGHSYVVSVFDTRTGRRMTRQHIRFFDPQLIGDHPAERLEAVCGGLLREENPFGSLCMSVNAPGPGYYLAHFKLRGINGNLPDPMPEAEVRVYFPDGSIASQFVPVRQDYTYIEPDRYTVEMPVLINFYNQGICYVEVIVLDTALAGFSFATHGKDITGSWSGASLRPLPEYSLAAATARIREHLSSAYAASARSRDDYADEPGSGSDDSPAIEAESLDEVVDRYIASQSGDTPEETDDASATLSADPDADAAADADMLDELTGLDSVKSKLRDYEKIARFSVMRASQGLPELSQPLHALFLGSPGTGKTTVAKAIGRMLCRAGVLSKGHVVVRERSALIGPHYGDEEAKTLQALEEARGGILFIDEAYLLSRPEDPRDPGRIVIETLLTALADPSQRDWMLILAGYPEPMRKLMELNDGLCSRIPESNVYTFEDFTCDQLMEIAERYLERNHFTLADDAREALRLRLADDYAHRDARFGNARHVINLIQTVIIPAMAVRVVAAAADPAAATSAVDPADLTVIRACDIPAPSADRPSGSARPAIGFCA